MTSVVNIASGKRTCCFVGEECIASLKDAANRAAMKLRYARGG